MDWNAGSTLKFLLDGIRYGPTTWIKHTSLNVPNKVPDGAEVGQGDFVSVNPSDHLALSRGGATFDYKTMMPLSFVVKW